MRRLLIALAISLLPSFALAAPNTAAPDPSPESAALFHITIKTMRRP